MAERRMFAKSIIDSDTFLDMPLSAQALYFHLSMRADDDGFVSSPNRIQRTIGCSNDDFKLLVAKSFIIPFDSGVVVIRHWKIHNYIRSDRYRPTVHVDEKAQLTAEKNGSYTLGIPTVDQRETQVRLGKYRDSIGEDRDSVGEGSAEGRGPAALPAPEDTKPMKPKKPKKEAIRHKRGEYGWVLLSDDEYARLLRDLGEAELKRCIDYVDNRAQLTSNKNGWKDWNLTIRNCHREGWGLRSFTPAPAQPQEKKSFAELVAERGGCP